MKDSYRQCSNRTADGSFSIPTALFKTLSADKTGLKDEKGIGRQHQGNYTAILKDSRIQDN